MLVMYFGHLYCAILVLALSFISFKEIIHLKRKDEKESKILFNWIDKYYFGTLCFTVLPQFLLLSKKLRDSIQRDNVLRVLLDEYHEIISYFLFIFGILFFVISLEKSSLRYHFKRLTWTLITLFVVFAFPWPIFYNIYKGLFWFAVPHAIVAINDMASFAFNHYFGKTPLIALAPKKTWEGFLGGVVTTFFLGYIIADCFATIPYLVCPQTHVTFSLVKNLQCEIPNYFIVQKHRLPLSIMGYSSILIRPSTLHSLVFIAFACFVTPFGGFLMNGIKRGLRIDVSKYQTIRDKFIMRDILLYSLFILQLLIRNLLSSILEIPSLSMEE